MMPQEIDSLIKRAKNYFDSISVDIDPELGTLANRYLCILFSSNIDKSIQLILTEYARRHGSQELVRFVAKRHQRGTNYNTERLMQILSLFSAEWASEFTSAVGATNLKEQLDSLYGLRNSISHGEQVNVSRSTLGGYLEAHVKIIGILQEIILS